MLNFTYRVRSLFHRIHVHSRICIAVFYKPGDMFLHFGTQMLHKDSGVELRKMCEMLRQKGAAGISSLC